MPGVAMSLEAHFWLGLKNLLKGIHGSSGLPTDKKFIQLNDELLKTSYFQVLGLTQEVLNIWHQGC